MLCSAVKALNFKLKSMNQRKPKLWDLDNEVLQTSLSNLQANKVVCASEESPWILSKCVFNHFLI